MKKKLIVLNLVLAALVVFAGMKIRDEWTAEQRAIDSLVRSGVKPLPYIPPVVPPAPPPVTPANYTDIAQKMLFAKDRNPNVVVEVVKEPPPPPMPALPVLRGVMGLPSGLLALIAVDGKSPGKPVHVGDKVGEFELASLTRDQISFQWKDKTVTRSVSEMIFSAPEEVGVAAPPPPPGKAAPQAPAVPPPDAGKPGLAVGSRGFKACAPGDPTPAGTVVDGYTKVDVKTPFGTTCRWDPVK